MDGPDHLVVGKRRQSEPANVSSQPLVDGKAKCDTDRQDRGRDDFYE